MKSVCSARTDVVDERLRAANTVPRKLCSHVNVNDLDIGGTRGSDSLRDSGIKGSRCVVDRCDNFAIWFSTSAATSDHCGDRSFFPHGGLLGPRIMEHISRSSVRF